jgi:hypothetical protein
MLICVFPMVAEVELSLRERTNSGAPTKCKPLAYYEEGGFADGTTGSMCMDTNGATVICHYGYHGCLGPT